MKPRTRGAAAVSRGLDLVLAVLGLTLTAPLVGATALAIRLHDRGPVLYADRREGRGGKDFAMVKLRTMVVDADRVLADHLATDPAARQEWLRFYRLARDPRVASRAARIARRMSIDELPQLVNVLRGEMSLVGPRPLPTHILDTLDRQLVTRRREVRPGLTGLWQVTGRSDLDMAELERLDRIYLDRRTLLGDLRILARTPRAVLSGAGAY